MSLIVDIIVSRDLVQLVADNVKNSKVVPSTLNGIRGFVDSALDSVGRNKMAVWKETTLPTPDKISVLRIWSHGYTHWIGGGDINDGNVIFGKDNLKADNIEKFSTDLRVLTPYFANPARVELRGCAAAKGSGQKMMLSLAKIWGVDVHGSDKEQSLVTLWQPPVYVATKDGNWGTTAGVEVYEGR